jgi:hypothetical protein
MNKTLHKISDKLNSHDSIIMACSTFGCKYILTLEKGYNLYWVRVYENGKLYKQKAWVYCLDAREEFLCYKRDFPELKYNNYDGGLKHYVHKQ